MACFCPYCGKEVGRDIEKTWLKGHAPNSIQPHRFEYECSECGEVLGVQLVQRPQFYTYKRDLFSYFGEVLDESSK